MKRFKNTITTSLVTFICTFLGFQIYKALSSGSFYFASKGTSQKDMIFNDNPVLFVIFLGVYIVLFVIFFGLIVHPLYSWIDRQFKAYGGNYNINTFIAIIRGGFK